MTDEFPKFYGLREYCDVTATLDYVGKWYFVTDAGSIVPFAFPEDLKVEDQVGHTIDWYTFLFDSGDGILLPIFEETPLIYKV